MDTYIVEQGRYDRISDPRLGRLLRHDSRSRRYAYRSVGPILSVRHERHCPIFNQGDLGSCTGNAAVGALGTGRLYDTVAGRLDWDEDTAVDVYSDATSLDDFAGQYPPTDTGSDGLSVAKVLQHNGWISGYRHPFGIVQALAALQDVPLIVGTDWRADMYEPDRTGLVSVSGPIEGGHEYVMDEYDAMTRRVGFTNSWGDTWGMAGRFYMDVEAFGQLLADQGDVVAFVPVTQPAPEPDPGRPTPEPDRDLLALSKAVRSWRHSSMPMFGSYAAQDAVDTFLRRKGL